MSGGEGVGELAERIFKAQSDWLRWKSVSSEALASVRELDWAQAPLFPEPRQWTSAESGGEGRRSEGQTSRGPLDPLLSERRRLRRRLDSLDAQAWALHTDATSPSQSLFQRLHEIDTWQHLSKGTTKLLQMLASEPMLVSLSSDGSFGSLHICEGAGGMVVALKRHLETMDPQLVPAWHYVATSRNPLSSAFADEETGGEAALRVVSSTEPHWEFGPDDQGQLFNRDTRQAVLKRSLSPLSSAPRIRLVTADGAVKTDDYSEAEEELSFPLVLAETELALRCLESGGSLVLKVHGLATPQSSSLLALLGAAFQTLRLTKPCASEGGSSELYVLALGFRGREGAEGVAARSFLSAYEDVSEEEKPSLAKPILHESRLPEPFARNLAAIAAHFLQRQVDLIRLNINSSSLSLDARRLLYSTLASKHSVFAKQFSASIGFNTRLKTLSRHIIRGGKEKPETDGECLSSSESIPLLLTHTVTRREDVADLSSVVFGSPVEHMSSSLAISSRALRKYEQERETSPLLPGLCELDLCPSDSRQTLRRDLRGQGGLLVDLSDGKPSMGSWLELVESWAVPEEVPESLTVRAGTEGGAFLLASRGSLSLVALLACYFSEAELGLGAQGAYLKCWTPRDRKTHSGQVGSFVRAVSQQLLEEGDRRELRSLFRASTLRLALLHYPVQRFNHALLRRLSASPPPN